MLVLMIVVMFMVMMMLVFVLMVVHVLADLLLAVHGHAHVGAGDAALHGGLGGEGHAGQIQAVQLFDKGRLVGQQFQQRRGEHIAGRAHGALDIEHFHERISSCV